MMTKVTKEKCMDESVFDGYVCGITGNPCCGCSLYCEHRRPKDDKKNDRLIGEQYNIEIH